jgi:hypothetical protein
MIAFLRRIGVLRNRKVIQISTVPSSVEGRIVHRGGVHALCNDGSMWFRRSGGDDWEQRPGVPAGWGR